MAPDLLSSGNASVDFFFHVVPYTSSDSVTVLLELAWAHDPSTALKLVGNLRAVRGTGKSDRESFYAAAIWIHRHHPKTLALNISRFADLGYIKDLPEILTRLADDYDPAGGRYSIAGAGRKRKSRKDEMKKHAMEFYLGDMNYRFLHDQISNLIADLLRSDLEHLKSGDITKISLAAKWCPSLDSSHDRSTLLCESIGRRIFPRDSIQEYRVLEDSYYGYRVRDRLRKEVLVPLRKALELPEIYISSNQWESIPYDKISSTAMNKYKNSFRMYDGERFLEYQQKVSSGKSAIAAGAMLPHEILAAAGKEEVDMVAELQWKRMVKDLSEKGKLTNSLAVCAVGGSTMKDPCAAMGLLISELSEPPWRGVVITFGGEAQMHRIKGETLREKAGFIKDLKWGSVSGYNLQGVLDRILAAAVAMNLPPEKMIRRLFVFGYTDSDGEKELDYQATCSKFEEHGYGSAVPDIVFWNLSCTWTTWTRTRTPVVADQERVALVGGFSKNLMRLFLEGDGFSMKPEDVMRAAISGVEYKNLVVYD